MLGYPPGEIEVDYAHAVRDLLGAHLLTTAEAPVHQDGNGVQRLPQDHPLDGAPLGPEVLDFFDVAIVVARPGLWRCPTTRPP